jgi:hypothetical protein
MIFIYFRDLARGVEKGIYNKLYLCLERSSNSLLNYDLNICSGDGYLKTNKNLKKSPLIEILL